MSDDRTDATADAAATAAALDKHEGICAERYANITTSIVGLRAAQEKLFATTDAINATLNRLAGKVVIIEAIMLGLLALGVYEVIFKPLFEPTP